MLLLQWLVSLTAGGAPLRTATPASASGGGQVGGGGQEGGEEEERCMDAAAMAAEVWPRLSKVPRRRRAAALQGNELFLAVTEVRGGTGGGGT